MIELRQAREIRGEVKLPSCPDLYLLTACAAVSTGVPAQISPAPSSPLVEDLEAGLANVATFVREGDICTVRPVPDSGAATARLPYPELAHRDAIVFMLLGAGKTVSFDRLAPRRIESLQRMARTVGCTIEVKKLEGRTGLFLGPDSSLAIPEAPVHPNDLHACLGLAIGLRRVVSLTIEFPFVTPLRHLMPLFGYPFDVRSNTVQKTDPLAKRLRFLGVKRKTPVGQSFTISADFSVPPASDTKVDLPGDSVLGASFMVAKALVQRGALIIDNVPLEPWASAMVANLRNLGCKLGIQETRESSFGSTGMLQLQAFPLTGRKIDCVPLFHYVDQLPGMVVLSCFAAGQTVLRGLEDLRDDEPDPVERMLAVVRQLGARHGEMPDGMVIDGAQTFDGFDLTDPLPAVLAGPCATAALRCAGQSKVEESSIVRRWPRFMEAIDGICEYRS